MVLGPGMPLDKVLGKTADVVVGHNGRKLLNLVKKTVGLVVSLKVIEAIKTAVGKKRVGQPSNLEGSKVDSISSDPKVSVKTSPPLSSRVGKPSPP